MATDHLTTSDNRRFATGDHVIARAPDRHLHPAEDRSAYVRNGATGTITAIRHGATPADDTLVVDFTGIATIDIPRTFFDPSPDRPEPGLDHAYAVTSWAVQSATNPVSTSRIDPAATRAEAYVDITRGRHANHLYLTRPPDPLDGETLPRTPPDPLQTRSPPASPPPPANAPPGNSFTPQATISRNPQPQACRCHDGRTGTADAFYAVPAAPSALSTPKGRSASTLPASSSKHRRRGPP